MGIDKIAKQIEASQRKMEEIQSEFSKLNGNLPNKKSDIAHDFLEKNESLFDVVFEGKPRSGIPLENAIDGLARLSRKQPDELTNVFNERPRKLKRNVSKATALQYHQALHDAGLACHIAKAGSPLVADETEKLSDVVSPPKDDKIACSKCGTMILPSTSKKTGGFCMTCYKSSPDYESKSEKIVKDKPKYNIVGGITAIAMLLGIVAGIINYVLQFSEMWEDAGMILTLAAFPLFPLGGALIATIIGFIIGWIINLIASPFIPKTN